MVKRVFGSCNGKDIILTENGDRWNTLVPTDTDGTFVVDLYAEDEAGNIGYFATILYTVDLNGLLVEIRVLNYNSNIRFKESKYFLSPYIKDYTAKFVTQGGGRMLKIQSGERRTVYVDISSDDDAVFEISEARFKVYKERTHEIVTEGQCNVDGHQLSNQIQLRSGLYEIHYVLNIGNDIIIRKKKLKVEKCHEFD
ncbi:MAG: PF13754 domain-containing protein [Lachnospiraceae bacterium]|nr:PF13754 domain-containing protein [Lachnospiraceae bacterium]